MCQEYSSVPSSVCRSASCIGTFDGGAVSSIVEVLLLCVKVFRLVLLLCVKSTVVCQVVFVSVRHVYKHLMLVQSPLVRRLYCCVFKCPGWYYCCVLCLRWY